MDKDNRDKHFDSAKRLKRRVRGKPSDHPKSAVGTPDAIVGESGGGLADLGSRDNRPDQTHAQVSNVSEGIGHKVSWDAKCVKHQCPYHECGCLRIIGCSEINGFI